MRPSELVKFLIRAAPDPAAAVTRHRAGRHFSCDLPGLRAPAAAAAARARGGSGRQSSGREGATLDALQIKFGQGNEKEVGRERPARRYPRPAAFPSPAPSRHAPLEEGRACGGSVRCSRFASPRSRPLSVGFGRDIPTEGSSGAGDAREKSREIEESRESSDWRSGARLERFLRGGVSRRVRRRTTFPLMRGNEAQPGAF